MRDEDVTAMLQEDFTALETQLEGDNFLRALKHKIETQRRRRIGVLAGAGLLGAGLAAAQFGRLFESVAQVAAAAEVSWLGSGETSLLVASLIVATAVVATAAVLQREG